MAAIPIAMGGFQSRVDVCADVPGLQRDPSTLEITARASHENNLDALIDCFLGELSHPQWLPRPPDQYTEPFAVRLVKRANQLDRRLARFRSYLKPAKNERLVEAKTSRDAITVTAAILLKQSDSGGFAVSAMYMDFLFEE